MPDTPATITDHEAPLPWFIVIILLPFASLPNQPRLIVGGITTRSPSTRPTP